MFKEISGAPSVDGSIDVSTEKQTKLQMMEAETAEQNEKVPRKTALESLRVCLFCNAERDGVKKVLDHMRTKHSFFLIDVDCLTDLKGLMTYLAEKVHIGQMCVFCNKIFKDPMSTQQHMLDKRHCFMNIEDFEVEYEKFYDFSKTYESFVDVKGSVHVNAPSKDGEKK
jgi:pre-60S factor REI1